jgi:hypothetical protein
MPQPCAHIGFAFALAHCVQWYLALPVCYDTNVLSEVVDLVLLVSSLLPDLVDKPLYLCRLCKATRTFGHTLAFAAATIAAAWYFQHHVCGSTRCAVEEMFVHLRDLACDWVWVYGVAIGLLSHLAADLMFGYVPLFWPLQPFRYPSMVHTKASIRCIKALDLAATVYLLLFSRLPYRVYQLAMVLVQRLL